MSRPRSRLLTRQELAAALAIHPRTTFAWMREGMPSVRRHGTVLFSLASVEAWIEKRGRKRAEGTEARAQRERAHAHLAEQTVAFRARALVSRLEAEKVWAAYVRRLRARLRRIPRELGRELMASIAKNPAGGVDVVERKLQDHVRAVLTELADP